MKYLSIIYLVLVSLTTNAQDTLPCNCNVELKEAFVPKLKGQVYRGLPGLVGVEFFNRNYVNGDIYLENGDIAFNQRIKYNGRIDGLLLFPPKSAKEILLDNYLIKGFCLTNDIGNTCLRFTKIKVVEEFGSDSIHIFGQVLYENKLSLYAYRCYSYQKDINTEVGSQMIAKKLYGPSFVYYFRLPNNKTIGFTSFKKRDLYKLFPENTDLMKRIFKEKHQRRFRDEEDLIRITQILNSLYK